MSDAISSTDLKKILPLLARHEGVWEGTYQVFNVAGEKTDEHLSRLICRFPETGAPYHQTNHYRWADGRREVRDFPAGVKNNRLFFDNELINGWACDVALDDFNRTTMLNWVRTGEPDLYLYEMIQLSDDGQARARVWQWFKADRLFQRTLIQEKFITADWAAYEGQDF